MDCWVAGFQFVDNWIKAGEEIVKKEKVFFIRFRLLNSLF